MSDFSMRLPTGDILSVSDGIQSITAASAGLVSEGLKAAAALGADTVLAFGDGSIQAFWAPF